MNKDWTVEVPDSRVSCLCETPDDWYPTTNGVVKLSVVKLSAGTRICVWGGDDFGLEKDKFITFEAALQEADAIPVPIAQTWLRSHGYGST